MQESVVSSGTQTAAKQIFTARGKIHALVLTPAAAASTITVYDNTSAAGTAVLVLSAPASGASTVMDLTNPIEFQIGCYIAVTGTGAQFAATWSRC